MSAFIFPFFSISYGPNQPTVTNSSGIYLSFSFVGKLKVDDWIEA